MSPIPWGAILRHGPTILSAARSLLASQSATAHERNRSIDARLEQLEQASVETARLVEQMAEQLQSVTLAQQETQRRLRTTLIVGAVAAVIAVGALLVALTT
jgi:hypothetical protein